MKKIIAILLVTTIHFYSVAQTNTFPSSGNVGIVTTSPVHKVDINSLDHDNTRLRLANTTSSGINAAGSFPAIEVLAARGDGNITYGGRLALGTRRTDGNALNNQTLGAVLFGGQHGTDNNFQGTKILYPASIQGIAEGAFTNSIMMPTGIAFMTGVIGNDVGANNITYGTERMRITNNGDIGIGTTTPANKLHVQSGHISATVDANLSGFVQLWNDNAVIWKNGNGNAGLRFGSATNLQAASWSEKMRINDNGNVGIGTPGSARLHVYTPTTNDGIFLSGNAGFAFLQSNSSNGSWNGLTVPGDFGLFYGSAGQSNPGTNTNFGFVLAPWFNGIAGIRMDNNGNVGIGTNKTADANYKLFVETGIRTRKIKVDQITWADYVFETNYPLPSLQKVEEFIQLNKHLPGVPSAAEVEKNGIDLGDNQSVLLKKIEELTLYLIEQNKRIDAQNKRIEEQNKKIQQLDEQLKK